MDYDVIVAGLGAMGSATAAELAARGVRVLGLDRASIPNSEGSSHGVTRIIRLAYAEDPRYVPLVRRAYERWHALAARLGETILVTTGGLDMGTPTSDTVRGSLASVRQHDLVHELLEAEQINSRFPGFSVPREVVAVYQPDGGFLLSERAIAGHARLAIEDGAELHGHEPVEAWEAGDGGVVVRTAVAEYRARHLVVSAGAWVGKLVPSLAAVAVPERQVLIWVAARRPELYTPARLPVFILDVEDGLYFGLPEHDIPGLKFGIMHHRREVIDPDAWDRSLVEPIDEELLRAGIARYLPDADGPTLTLKTCMYTNAPDEHFTLGPLPGTPGVTVVSPCSGHGYKFASVMGEIAADLALDGGTDHDIEMFRLDRFGTGGPS